MTRITYGSSAEADRAYHLLTTERGWWTKRVDHGVIVDYPRDSELYEYLSRRGIRKGALIEDV